MLKRLVLVTTNGERIDYLINEASKGCENVIHDVLDNIEHDSWHIE